MGSTEVVESAFGVQKRLAWDQSKGRMTSSSVGIGAVPADRMRAELERVPEEVVSGWAKRWFGETVQWLRRKRTSDRPATNPNRSRDDSEELVTFEVPPRGVEPRLPRLQRGVTTLYT